MNIILIGFMGTGKTAVGENLSRRLGYVFEDTDLLIEKKTGRSISQIFEEWGEDQFRKLEKQAIREVSTRQGMVLATGGGAVLDPENLTILKRSGLLICLDARPATILSRLKGHQNRPLLAVPDREETILRLLERRRAFYHQANYILATDNRSVGQLAVKIHKIMKEHLTDRVRVGLPQNAYEIEIGWGNLNKLGERVAALGFTHKVPIVTNPLVKRYYGKTVFKSLKSAGFSPFFVEIPDGERYKAPRWVNLIYDHLVKNKIERGSCVIALGGGVIGDMAGFAAATYLRGVSYIQVPTTLAAQVDSSIGGKTGVNHPLGKNLIGAFFQPRLVYIDVKVLETLDQRNFKSGLAEVAKYGVIADADFFKFLEEYSANILERQPHFLVPAVKRSCEIKAQVVQEDEREGGLRQILNYGHTMGHALETVTHYRSYLHGEAVSIGMSFAARLAVELGICDRKTMDRQNALLVQMHLPIVLPKVNRRAILAAMAHDKKVKAGKIHFVLADRLGHVVIKSVNPSRIQKLLPVRA